MKDICRVKPLKNNILALKMTRPFQIDESKKYEVNIQEYRSKRSLEQNSYMWLLIGEIDKKLNGGRPNEPIDVYIHCLQRANAKYDFVYVIHDAVNELKKKFRAMEYIGKVEVNGVILENWKIYYGSSTMNTKEMSNLIDCVLDYASEVGIDDIDNYWKEILKGGK